MGGSIISFWSSVWMQQVTVFFHFGEKVYRPQPCDRKDSLEDNYDEESSLEPLQVRAGVTSDVLNLIYVITFFINVLFTVRGSPGAAARLKCAAAPSTVG